jgi:hypothetical protein
VAPSLRQEVENLRRQQPELPARPPRRDACDGRRRSSRANSGPNFKTHRRTVS